VEAAGVELFRPLKTHKLSIEEGRKWPKGPESQIDCTFIVWWLPKRLEIPGQVDLAAIEHAPLSGRRHTCELLPESTLRLHQIVLDNGAIAKKTKTKA
jgi:hypothetical protein